MACAEAHSNTLMPLVVVWVLIYLHLYLKYPNPALYHQNPTALPCHLLTVLDGLRNVNGTHKIILDDHKLKNICFHLIVLNCLRCIREEVGLKERGNLRTEMEIEERKTQPFAD